MNNLRVVNSPTAIKLNTTEDTYLQKVVKYIPAEIVAGYTALRGLLLENISAPSDIPYGPAKEYYMYIVIFAACLVLTPLYKYFSLKDATLAVPIFQIIISIIAFTVWVFTFGDLFEIYMADSYNHKFAAIIMILFTLTTPVLEKLFVRRA